MNVYWIFNVLITDTQLLPLYIRFHLIVIYTTVQTIVFINIRFAIMRDTGPISSSEIWILCFFCSTKSLLPSN